MATSKRIVKLLELIEFCLDEEGTTEQEKLNVIRNCMMIISTHIKAETATATITYNKEIDEYNVPNTIKNDTGYFTNDKDDAIGTCKKIWGNEVIIKFKNIKSE